MGEDMMSFYHGDEYGQTPGLLPEPYYCELIHIIMKLPSLRNTSSY